MEVLEECSGWMSNYEVLQHLKTQKSERDAISKRIGRPVQTAENIQTVEFEVGFPPVTDKIDYRVFGSRRKMFFSKTG